MVARWITRGAFALLLTGPGGVAAQTSPTVSGAPAALAQPRSAAPAGDSPIVRMRTAGQPDRILKIIKQTSYTDGEGVAEVQDVQSGQIFTMPGKVAAMLPRENGTISPQPVAAPQQIPAPVPQPPPAVTPVIRPAPQPAQVEPRVIHIPPPQAEPTVAAKPAPVPEPKAEIKPLPPAVELPPLPPPTPVAPSTDGIWRVRPAESPATDPAKPDRWQPTKRPDAGWQSMTPERQTIVRGTHHTGHDEPGPVEPPAARPRVLEDRRELVPVVYRSVETQIRNETQGYVYDLASALRPSVREDAAICLAESRYGSRREVKAVLAKAAIADPAPSVRAKCIELLMRLGYHDPEYMAFLRSATHPGEAPIPVRAAASEALAKLMPRVGEGLR